MTTDGLWLRLAGVATIIAGLAIYQPGQPGFSQQLAIPLLMGLGAWWMVRNVAAVAFGTVVLAVIHSNLQAADWVPRIAYPLVAGVSGIVLLAIAVRRFRVRIAATHDARWATRHAQGTDEG